MPNTAETIEILARKLERARILNDLKECQTIEDYQQLVKKYEKLCNDDKACTIFTLKSKGNDNSGRYRAE